MAILRLGVLEACTSALLRLLGCLHGVDGEVGLARNDCSFRDAPTPKLTAGADITTGADGPCASCAGRIGGALRRCDGICYGESKLR